MNPTITLLASNGAVLELAMCGPISHWDSVFILVTPLVIFGLLLTVVALVRSQIGIFKRDLPVLPRSPWFYVLLAVVSLVITAYLTNCV